MNNVCQYRNKYFLFKIIWNITVKHLIPKSRNPENPGIPKNPGFSGLTNPESRDFSGYFGIYYLPIFISKQKQIFKIFDISFFFFK